MKNFKKIITTFVLVALFITSFSAINTDTAQAASNSSTIKGIEKTTVKTSTSLTDEGKIKISWSKSKGFKVDYYQVYTYGIRGECGYMS